MTAHAAADRSGAAGDSKGATQSSSFRPDIQGMRALAVVSVVLDHAHIAAFSGGFVGVDVFFVISGFLITQLLLHEAQRTGTISLLSFYSRRARRILPAATVVLVVTVLASVLLLGFVQSTSVVTDSIWSALFAANVKFGRDGTDYFAADNPPSPLQHFWSLSIEEQFYLVWPLLLLLLLVGVGLWRLRRGASGKASGAAPDAGDPRRVRQLPAGPVLAALVVLGGASLAWSIALTDRNPTAAYFSTPARVWELAMGAICAVLIQRITMLPRWLRATMAWAGLGAVGVAIFHYTALTAFPGKAALLPVVGTALMILGGAGNIIMGPQLLLARKGCRLIGDWSYSLYLWHWPFLIIGAAYLEHSLTSVESALLLLGALGASVVTYRYVENPFRRSRPFWRKPARGVLLYPTAIAVTLVACLAAHEAIQRQIDEASHAPPITLPGPGVHTEDGHQLSTDPAIELVQASVIAAQHHAAVVGHLTPDLLSLGHDIADVGHCDYKYDVRTLCKRGDVNSDKTIVVFGDSHARSWIPAIEPIAVKEGYAAYYLVKPGCNAAKIAPDFGHGLFQDCLDWRRWAMSQIERLHPAVLIVAGDLPPGLYGPDGQDITNLDALASAYQSGLAASLHTLQPSVGRIIVMGDVPGVAEPTGVCLSARGANLGDCAFPRSYRSRLLFQAAHAVATQGGYEFIDPIPWFCADDLCPSVIGVTVTYRDTEHITTEYAAELSRPLEAALHIASAT